MGQQKCLCLFLSVCASVSLECAIKKGGCLSSLLKFDIASLDSLQGVITLIPARTLLSCGAQGGELCCKRVVKRKSLFFL